jgi:hypothetical protein
MSKRTLAATSVAAVLAGCTLGSTATSVDASSPEAFVRSLYASDGAAMERQSYPRDVYSARTAALFAENDRLYQGYVGYPDADPICDCQDGEDLALTRAATQVIDADHARVDVALSNGQSHTFVLVREAGNWRIDDIEGLSGGPLVAGLEASNAEARTPSSRD